MKEGQHDNHYITGDSITTVSSSSAQAIVVKIVLAHQTYSCSSILRRNKASAMLSRVGKASLIGVGGALAAPEYAALWTQFKADYRKGYNANSNEEEERFQVFSRPRTWLIPSTSTQYNS